MIINKYWNRKIIVLINSFDKDFNYSCPLILDKIQNKKLIR